MYSIGCLTRTIFFIDYCMDSLSIILLLFSLIKLLIIIFFYSFIYIYQRYKKKYLSSNNRNSMIDSTHWRHSSSFDSSSNENLPKKLLLTSSTSIPIKQDNQKNDFIEKRHIILNDYDTQSPTKRVQNAPTILSPATFDNNNNTPISIQQTLRKLSSISEKTEKDDSEPDLLRYNSRRKAIITAINQNSKSLPPPPPLPKKLPIIKNRKRIVGDDENDNDSGI